MFQQHQKFYKLAEDTIYDKFRISRDKQTENNTASAYELQQQHKPLNQHEKSRKPKAIKMKIRKYALALLPPWLLRATLVHSIT